MRKLRIVLRRWARKLLGLEDPPGKIALGAAVGTFIAFGPTWGCQIILALGLAALLRCNKAATLLPTFIVNPVTGPVTFFLQYLLGKAILFSRASAGEIEKVKELAAALGGVRLRALRESVKAVIVKVGALGWDVLLPVLVGMLVSAAALALVAYPATYRGVVWFRRKRQERREVRHARLAAAGLVHPHPHPHPGTHPHPHPPPEARP